MRYHWQKESKLNLVFYINNNVKNARINFKNFLKQNFTMSSMKSKSSTIRRPKTMNHADSKSLLDDRNINGIYFIHSMKKLKDFKSHQQQANITSNVIYSDFKLKMSRFGYYYIYAFINIEDSSVYSFDLNKGELQIFKGDNYQVGKLIACGNSCQVTLEPGIFLLSIVYKHEEDEDSEEFVSYSSVSPDLILEYSSIGVAWPLNVRNIEKQVIPKEKCHLPVNDLFMPVKTESRYLQLDNRSVSSMSSRSPLRRPIAPNKIKRRESDPNEMRDMLEYKEHLERQVHYYASVIND